MYLPGPYFLHHHGLQLIHALRLLVKVVKSQERTEIRHFQREQIALPGVAGQGNQAFGHGIAFRRVPQGAEGRIFHRLIAHSALALQVTRRGDAQATHRCQNQRQAQAHLELVDLVFAAQMVTADGHHEEGRHRDAAEEDVREPLDALGVAHHRPETGHHGLTIHDLVAHRVLHPGIGNDDPEGADGRADGGPAR